MLNNTTLKTLCKRTGVAVAIATVSTSVQAGWEVTWIDKFDGTGVNWDKWTAQTQANYNNEVQCYTDDETTEAANYDVSDGTLKITARRMNIDCPGQGGRQRDWTSGRLNSKDKGEFLYGRVEARIRFNELKAGTWPAFWMLENRINEQPRKGDDDFVGWPNPGAGEIDVWEWYANSPDRYITNFFNTGGCGGEYRQVYEGGAQDVLAFNTYAMEWTPDAISFYMNDQLVISRDMSNCSQYEEPMFVLINVAMGGTLGGNIDPTLQSATMEVDYVAHCTFSTANESVACNESTPELSDSDGDGISDSVDQCPDTPPGSRVDINGCAIATEPVVSASEPTIPESQVISLYSDRYTNIASIDYNPDWGQATIVSEIQVGGDNVLKYEGLNYQGTDFDNNRQDVSNMDFVHFDYWTHNAQTLQFFLISPGPVETPFTFNAVQQAWQSHTIPLSHFENVDLNHLFQLKVEGGGDVFFDNIYFSREAMQNIAPALTLRATQNNAAITQIDRQNGDVTVSVTIDDDNPDDQHSVSWSLTGVSGYQEGDNQVSFTPSSVTGQAAIISVSVSDNGQPVLTTQSSLELDIEAQPTVQPTQPTPTSSSSGGAVSVWLLLLAVFGIGLRYHHRGWQLGRTLFAASGKRNSI